MKKVSFLLIVSVLLLLPLALGLTVMRTSSFAYDGLVTVTQEDGKYYYSTAGVTKSDPFNTLQALIDEVRNDTSDLMQLSFTSVSSDSPITLSGKVSLAGNLTFSLPDETPAVTVASAGNLTVAGLTLTTDKNGIRLSYASFLSFKSGTIRLSVAQNDYNSYIAIDLNAASAEITGGIIDYPFSTSYGYGILVRSDSSLAINPSNPVSVSAPSALYLQGGETTISGGTIAANGTLMTGLSSGYSAIVDNTSTLTITGGTLENPIRFSGDGATLSLQNGTFTSLHVGYGISGTISLKDAHVRPSGNSYVYVDLSDFDTDVASFTSSAGITGYRAYAATPDGGNTKYFVDEEMPLDVDVTYDFLENNKYVLTIYDGAYLGAPVYSSAEYAYNTEFLCSEIAFEKPGYAVDYWREDTFDGNTIDSFTLKGDKDLYVDTRLLPCSVEVSDQVLTYDGTAKTISATVEHALKNDPSATYTATWEKYVASDWQPVCATETLSVTTVADGGRYRFSASITHNAVTRTTAQEITVTMQKGTYQSITHPSFEGTYNRDQYLSAFILNDGFRWVNAMRTPTVPIKEYDAIYNGDEANYNDFELKIVVDLQKAPSVYPPNSLYSGSAVTGTYDPEKTLADYQISGTTWNDPTIVPAAGSTGYGAKYNPDADNYEDKPVTVTLHIAKASYVGNKDLDLSLSYSSETGSFNAIRNYVANNYPGYIVTSGEEPVIGVNAYSGVYNADPTNYNDYPCAVTITLSKRDYLPAEVPTHPPVTLYYNHSLSEIVLNSGFRFANVDEIPTQDGDYPAYYNINSAYYNDYATTISVTLEKLVYDPSEVPSPELASVVYDPERTLSDVALPSGFAWKDPLTIPTVAVSSYPATYQGDVWHEAYELDVSLTVKKATLSSPVFNDGTFVYDGQPHGLICETIPDGITLIGYVNNDMTNAGQYEVIARFSQADEENYVAIPKELSATMTIQKAPSVITATTWIDVLVGQEVTWSGSVNNEEQNVIFPEVSTERAGVYIKTLRTMESANYLEGSLDVTVSVNNVQKYVGSITYPSDYDGTYYYGILSAETGVSEDLTANLSNVETNAHTKAMAVSLTHDGVSASGLYEIKLLLPEEMRGKAITVSTDSGIVESSVQSGVYLVFSIRDGDTVYFDYEANKKPFVWYWIPPVAVIVVAGIVVAIVFILRKRKKTALATLTSEPTEEKKEEESAE